MTAMKLKSTHLHISNRTIFDDLLKSPGFH